MREIYYLILFPARMTTLPLHDPRDFSNYRNVQGKVLTERTQGPNLVIYWRRPLGWRGFSQIWAGVEFAKAKHRVR